MSGQRIYVRVVAVCRPDMYEIVLVQRLVDADENRTAWKKQRENTAGEPSSLSVSHYKTAS